MHSHCHGHHGHEHFSPKEYTKVFAVAVALNLGFVIIQASYAWLANSMSLLADAGHNLGDVLGLMMAWGANYLLSKGPSQRYSYRHKKTTIMAALLNAILLVVTSLFIIEESIIRLFSIHSIHELTVIIVASIGIAINGGTALLFMRDRDRDLNIKAAFWHLLADTLISAGVVIAAVIIFYTKWYWLDPVIGLLIVVTILFGTWGLLRDTVNLLLDAVPRDVCQQAVRDYMLSIPGVSGVHDLHIWGLSTHEIALTAHLVSGNGDVDDYALQKINDELMKRFKIRHVTLQVERGHLDDPCGQAESCH